LWVVFAGVVVASLAIGLRARHAVWERARPTRDGAPLANDWSHGQRVLRHGFLDWYDHVASNPSSGSPGLGHPPLRLLAITLWARWTNLTFPGVTAWRGDRRFNAPLLHLNTVAEVAAAVGVFLVVRLWAVRSDLAPRPPPSASRFAALRDWLTGVRRPHAGLPPRPRQAEAPPLPRPFHGFGRATLAGALFWLNPALLLGAHAAPRWDGWVAPFFAFAVYAALRERWFATGLLLGVGAMLTGRLLPIAPLFVLWPLFMNAPRAATRVVVGFAFAAAVVAAPWLLGRGAVWVAGVAMVPLIVRPSWFGRRPLAVVWITVPVALELALWPLILPAGRAVGPAVALVTLAVVPIVAARRMGAGWVYAQTALAVAAALFLCPVLFDGSVAWLTVSFRVGAAELHTAAENLPAILARHFGLPPSAPLSTFDLPAPPIHHVFTVAQGLLAGYALLLVATSVAAARHAKRCDARLPVALVVPWLLGFALPAQADGRHLVWAACLSAAWVGAGAGPTLLHLLITGLAFASVACGSVPHDPAAFPALAALARASAGGVGWLVVLTAGVACFLAVTRAHHRPA
jgi:hypothetical protein